MGGISDWAPKWWTVVVYEMAAYVGPPRLLLHPRFLRSFRSRVLDDSRTRPTPSTHARALSADESDIVVRPVATRAECQACVALQREIWGPGHDDAVPASILQVVAKVGGIVAGAFTTDGELVGFVFGLPAFVDGATAHWSHILGVRESARNGGVGRLLKEYQRAELARRGIPRMYWTFDPLVAKNAHLNLNLLGAHVVEYVRDMYGTTNSPLHNGLATDRLVVVCEIDPRMRRAPRATARGSHRTRPCSRRSRGPAMSRRSSSAIIVRPRCCSKCPSTCSS